ncbi:MAG: ABC transporter substrate-binding protein [Clostridium sp.]|uniref:ABC transporter substrate-binding protein n=1 Tax=Clostridium sp. TaxID=1506 RepID=UPI00290A2136|nr:ABC transporter substrate-binding protein [Clostridium sp.]MDU7337339.1 ABC transporter substrate-binding protein [Clostridium sp.]
MKKVLAFCLAMATMTASMTACSSPNGSTSSASSATPKGEQSVYYLNFKPESAAAYEEIAKKYKEETGVTLNVVTAASGTYEQTLKAEIAKTDAPTLFQINGPRGYASWKDYCADLKDTELYKHLSDKSLAIKDGEGVYGVPYVVEGYGIIYNQAIMDKYFKTSGAKASSIAEINSYAKLKAVAEDMTAKKDALGIKGVFSSTSLKPGEDWRWQTHLANVPVYYEFKENKVDLTSDATKEIKFQYSDNFKNIFDLYLNNSITPKNLLGTKQVDDSMSEFALGQTAMVQNGNWAWGQIEKVKGNTVKAEDVKFLPIYTGMPGEENQGLCIGTENFFAINKQASPEKQKAAEDFIYWLYSSKTGKDFVTNKLNFIAPFDTFTESEKPTDPLAKDLLNWMAKKDINTVPWNFTVFPSQTFKDNFGSALLQYAQGNKSWDDVKKLVVTEWKSESNQ